MDGEMEVLRLTRRGGGWEIPDFAKTRADKMFIRGNYHVNIPHRPGTAHPQSPPLIHLSSRLLQFLRNSGMTAKPRELTLGIYANS